MTEHDLTFIRALGRAHAAGLRVAGHGVTRSAEARVLAVTSASEPNRWHQVLICGDELRCDCTAATHGRYCAHRALAHEHLSTCDRCQRESARAAAIARARAVTIRRDSAPLARSNAPISIYRTSCEPGVR